MRAPIAMLVIGLTCLGQPLDRSATSHVGPSEHRTVIHAGPGPGPDGDWTTPWVGALQPFMVTILAAAQTDDPRARNGGECGGKIKSDNSKGEQTRFVAASFGRSLEVVTDAMAAVGFMVEKSNESSDPAGAKQVTIKTKKRDPRITNAGGGAGGEYLNVELVEARENDMPGVLVTIDTKKTFAGRARQHNWSVPVLEEAQCLVAVLDADASHEAAAAAQSREALEVTVPDGLPIKFRLRRFLISAATTENETVAFQVSSDVVVKGAVVIRRGAAAQGRVVKASSAKSFNRDAKLEFSLEHVRAIDGRDIPLRGTVEALGGTSKAGVTFAAASFGLWGFLVKGSEKGVRAGSELVWYVDRDQTVNGTKIVSGSD
jgi:hypothetical protein